MERFERALTDTSVNIGGAKTIVLLEDNTDHVDAIRKIVEPLGYNLIAGSDWQLALQLAAYDARFFVLDIKLGSGAERVKGGLRALELLRLKFGDEVFVAVLTALMSEHERAIQKLRANMALQKSPRRSDDMARIIDAYEAWFTRERSLGDAEDPRSVDEIADIEGADADLLFPSDELAVRITGASLNDMALLLKERISVAAILGQKAPEHRDLEREIGARMRDELRGVLTELAERGSDEIALTKGRHLAGDLVRLIFRVLPITYESEAILNQLKNELELASQRGFSGEWGTVKLQGDEVVLDPSEVVSNEQK